MLRTNLATRPFYNEGLARIALGVVLALGLATLGAGVARLAELARLNGELSARRDAGRRAAADLQARTVEAQRAATPRDRTAVARGDARGQHPDHPARILLDRLLQTASRPPCRRT